MSRRNYVEDRICEIKEVQFGFLAESLSQSGTDE